MNIDFIEAIKSFIVCLQCSCLQCVDAVGWMTGRPVKLRGGMLPWLPVWARCRFAYGPDDATATLWLVQFVIMTSHV